MAALCGAIVMLLVVMILLDHGTLRNRPSG
jgi:hypothetical protein